MMLWNWTRKVVTWWVVTFVTGDDWSVAAAVGAGLLATWAGCWRPGGWSGRALPRGG
jgi:hypothetical protein